MAGSTRPASSAPRHGRTLRGEFRASANGTVTAGRRHLQSLPRGTTPPNKSAQGSDVRPLEPEDVRALRPAGRGGDCLIAIRVLGRWPAQAISFALRRPGLTCVS